MAKANTINCRENVRSWRQCTRLKLTILLHANAAISFLRRYHTILNSYPRHRFQARNDTDNEGVDEVDGGYNPFYGIAVVCVSIFLFCVLTVWINVWKTLAVVVLIALLLGVAGCFAPKGWLRWPTETTGRGASTSASAELVITVRATGGPAWPGYACAQVMNAPPAFAFQSFQPLKAAADGRSVSAPAVAASSSVVCSVCREDVRGGEMVRQVPACRHIFHVRCIDMWLHSHETCPMCRCVVSPPPFKAVTMSLRDAVEAPESSTDDDELPPV